MVLLTGLSVMYAMFIGDPSSGSPQGRFTFFVTCWLPHHFPRIMRKICGERVSNGAGCFFEFLFFKRNPFLQIVYAVLVLGGYMLLVWEVRYCDGRAGGKAGERWKDEQRGVGGGRGAVYVCMCVCECVCAGCGVTTSALWERGDGAGCGWRVMVGGGRWWWCGRGFVGVAV